MAVEAPLSKSKLNIKIPAGIWALGFVSMFMDVSSEMIHALLPSYLVTVHRGHRRGDGERHEDLLRRTVRLARQSQAADSPWLWTGGIHQADLPAGYHDRLGDCGARYRSHREGRARCPTGRADRRSCTGEPARGELRPAAGTRFCRGFCRATRRYRPDGAKLE